MSTSASPMSSRGPARSLRIGIVLGGNIIEERLIRGRETISIGQSAKNTFAVPLESLTYPLARAIYATRNTALPVGASVVGLAVTVIATQLLAPAVGLVAIPLGFAAGSATKLALLAAIVPFRLRRFDALAAEALSRPAD